MLTVNEVAEVFRIHPQTAYKWIYADKLPATKVGGKVLVNLEDVEKLIAKGRRS